MDRVVILDAGSQYTHLISNRIRRLGVYTEIYDINSSLEKVLNNETRGVILSGGPRSVYDTNYVSVDKRLFENKLPILGICYGMQLIVKELGGVVEKASYSKECNKEYGKADLKIKTQNHLFKNVDDGVVWMSHGDTASKLPEGFKVIGSTKDCLTAAITNQDNIYGVQFHPEVTHTENGMKILNNFLNITKAKREWSSEKYLNEIKDEMVKKINDNDILALVSGGIDSTVMVSSLAGIIREKGLESKIYAVHIDNGLMRKNESRMVKEALNKYGVNVDVFDESDYFLNLLKKVYNAEEKRRIIGDAFMNIRTKLKRRLEKKYDINIDESKLLLAQGTIYPDRIESGDTKHADRIKTHHNRTDLVQKLIKQGKIIEPLKWLYKDEVRSLGKLLGLPEEVVKRHPFPGPGGAIRVLNIDEEEDIPYGLEEKLNKITQSYGYEGYILPIKSVGVQGDNRTYTYVALLKGEKDWVKLEDVSTEITKRIQELNRVTYLLKPSIINDINVITGSYITKERLDVWRKADDITMDELRKNDLIDKVAQCPTILLPINFDNSKNESVVIRPVNTEDFMTCNFSKIDWKVVDKISEKIIKLPEINACFYDITHKPPGTTEWE